MSHGVRERYFPPDSSYDYFFLDQFFDQQYRQDEVFGLIVALFAILAIFISCMGLAVLVMFSCSTRIREMGIRKVLGASRRQLFFELGREFFLLIAIAVVIALPLSGWIMGDWLNHYSFRTDWKAWFFLVPVVLLCVISLLTIGSAASGQTIEGLTGKASYSNGTYTITLTRKPEFKGNERPTSCGHSLNHN